VTGDEMRDLSRLRRSSTDRHVAGVAGGLGRHLDVDPVIIRVAFVVLSFFGGAGLLAYGALWLLVPEDDTDDAVFDLDARTRNVALIGVAVLAALLTLGDVWGGPAWFPWPLIFLGLIAWVLITRRERRRERQAGQGSWTPPPAGYHQRGTMSGWVGATDAPAAGTGPDAPSSPATGGAAPHAAAAGTAYAPAPGGPGAPGAPSGPAGPAYWAPPPRPRPRDPRKAGPILFWFTLALILLAEGVLGTLDLAGVPVTDSAYPALALGITALMLLVGAFYGRAGGLILIGLVATVVTVGATVAGEYDGERIDQTPLTAAQVDDSYSVGSGEVVLDLSRVRDVEDLDGRDLEVHAGFGRVEVVLPDGVDVAIDARVEGPGHLAVLGGDRGGVNIEEQSSVDGGVDAPRLDLEAWVGVGEVEVRTR
jgi:phage shock protein PspC (stress-responsive transcriptional regulator)